MSHQLSPAKFLMIATAMLSTPVVGQEPLLTIPLASKADLVANNDATNEWDTREESTVIPLRHVQANWVVMNIQQLFRKQKEEFSIIGDDRQVVVRGNKRILDEILNVVESIDRPPKSIEEPRNDPKRSALPVGIAEEVVAELKDVESPEGRAAASKTPLTTRNVSKGAFELSLAYASGWDNAACRSLKRFLCVQEHS
jgi:type II secretory pathway component GspD/PulD (secretin)